MASRPVVVLDLTSAAGRELNGRYAFADGAGADGRADVLLVGVNNPADGSYAVLPNAKRVPTSKLFAIGTLASALDVDDATIAHARREALRRAIRLAIMDAQALPCGDPGNRYAASPLPHGVLTSLAASASGRQLFFDASVMDPLCDALTKDALMENYPAGWYALLHATLAALSTEPESVPAEFHTQLARAATWALRAPLLALPGPGAPQGLPDPCGTSHHRALCLLAGLLMRQDLTGVMRGGAFAAIAEYVATPRTDASLHEASRGYSAAWRAEAWREADALIDDVLLDLLLRDTRSLGKYAFVGSSRAAVLAHLESAHVRERLSVDSASKLTGVRHVLAALGETGPTPAGGAPAAARAASQPVACVHCGGAGLRVCAGCNYARYCSQECQRAHWKAHKPICRSMREQGGVTPAKRDVVHKPLAKWLQNYQNVCALLAKIVRSRIALSRAVLYMRLTAAQPEWQVFCEDRDGADAVVNAWERYGTRPSSRDRESDESDAFRQSLENQFATRRRVLASGGAEQHSIDLVCAVDVGAHVSVYGLPLSKQQTRTEVTWGKPLAMGLLETRPEPDAEDEDDADSLARLVVELDAKIAESIRTGEPIRLPLAGHEYLGRYV